MKIAFIPGQKGRLKGNFIEVARLLNERGAEVTTIDPTRRPFALHSLRVEHDLYIVLSPFPLSVNLAGMYYDAGAAFLNPYPLTALLANKARADSLLRRLGIPTPETYIAQTRELFLPLLAKGPLIIKPYSGSGGSGICVAYTAADIMQTPDNPHDFVMAQRYHAPDEPYDLKIYVMGDQVYCRRRKCPVRAAENKIGEPYSLPSAWEQMAKTIAAEGMKIFAMDMIVSRGQPYVVDVNNFASFTGVPEAARVLADYIYSEGLRRVGRSY